jgi:hypothetical protein
MRDELVIERQSSGAGFEDKDSKDSKSTTSAPATPAASTASGASAASAASAPASTTTDSKKRALESPTAAAAATATASAGSDSSKPNDAKRLKTGEETTKPTASEKFEVSDDVRDLVTLTHCAHTHVCVAEQAEFLGFLCRRV